MYFFLRSKVEISENPSFGRPGFQIRTGFLNVPNIAPCIRYRTLMFHASGVSPIWTPWPWLCRSWKVWAYDEWGVTAEKGGSCEGINGESICKETSEPAVEKNRLVSDFVTIPKGRCLQRFVRFREWNCWQVRGIACAGTSSAYLPNRGAFQKLSKTSQISETFGSCAFFLLHWAATDRSWWHLLVQRWHGFLWWKRTPLS